MKAISLKKNAIESLISFFLLVMIVSICLYGFSALKPIIRDFVNSSSFNFSTSKFYLQVFQVAAVAICLSFSLFIIGISLTLRQCGMFLFLGLYLFFLSTRSISQAFFVNQTIFISDLFLINSMRISGVFSGFAICIFIKEISGNENFKIYRLLIYSITSIIFALTLADIFFGINYKLYNLFPETIPFQDLRFIFLISSIFGQTINCLYLFKVHNTITEERRANIKILLIGNLCLFPFEVWDIIKLYLIDNPWINHSYIYCLGLLTLTLFSTILFIKIIKEHIENIPHKRKKINNEKLLNPNNKRIYSRILKVIKDEKLYLDPELSLDIIAFKIDINKVVASQIINSYHGCNFNTMINQFRVEYMKNQLEDPANNESILVIGLDSGFNSKTSINRTFFNITGLTPREYRNKVIN